MHDFDNLRKLQRIYTRLLEPVCSRWDLTRNELDVLLFLYNNPLLDRAADIVACRGISKSHVSLSVAALERRGYLFRQTDPTDRRTVRLKLTQAAATIGQAGKEAQSRLGKLLIADLSESELALWRTLNAKVHRTIEAMEDI